MRPELAQAARMVPSCLVSSGAPAGRARAARAAPWAPPPPPPRPARPRARAVAAAVPGVRGDAAGPRRVPGGRVRAVLHRHRLPAAQPARPAVVGRAADRAAAAAGRQPQGARPAPRPAHAPARLFVGRRCVTSLCEGAALRRLCLCCSAWRRMLSWVFCARRACHFGCCPHIRLPMCPSDVACHHSLQVALVHGEHPGGCKCQLQVSAWVQAAAGSQRRKQALAAVRHLVCRLAGAA